MKIMRILIYLASIVLVLFTTELCLSQNSPNSMINKQPKLSLQGKVENVLIEKEAKSSLIKIKLNLSLKNESNKRIIFLDYPVFFPGELILAPAQKGIEDEILVTSYGGYSCQYNAEEWVRDRNAFKDQEKPDKNVYFLDSGQEKLINVEVRLIVANLDNSQYFSTERDKSLETLQTFASLRLQVTTELYPSWGLEPKCKVEKLKFGKILRKKWENYGYLWLDDVTSEPMLLQLHK